MGNNKMSKKNKKDFSTKKQIDKIVSSVPNIQKEAIDFTKLNGGRL